MKLLLALLVALPVCANAELSLIARQGDNWVRITDKPCTNDAVLKLISEREPDEVENTKAAEAKWEGRVYQACWHVADMRVHVIYEDGDHGFIPVQVLEEDEDV